MGTSNGTSNGISAYMPVQCVREGASSGPLKGYTFAAKDLYDVRSLLPFPCVHCKRILLVSRASCTSTAYLKRYISSLATSPPSVPAARLGRVDCLWSYLLSKHREGMQVEGFVTGYGNPEWAACHAPATSIAAAVQVHPRRSRRSSDSLQTQAHLRPVSTCD